MDVDPDGTIVLLAPVTDLGTIPLWVAASSAAIGIKTSMNVMKREWLDVVRQGRMTGMQRNERAGFSARTIIENKESSLTWDQSLDSESVLVGEGVKITIEVELVGEAGQSVA